MSPIRSYYDFRDHASQSTKADDQIGGLIRGERIGWERLRSAQSSAFPLAGPLLTRRANLDLIAERWDDLLRLAGR